MTSARIFQKSKNAMQSGRAGSAVWMLEFEQCEAKRPDPLMGWAGSGDTRAQLALTFATLDGAKAYADRQGISYHIVPPAPKVIKLQAYSDNFR